ncbi:hypothetical protein chiPu_0020949 [Chiloscyllium punctatum]|uniref:VWFD domain-containing protein n=1 Tax=Chiloscyllium punctatum TaxID=137246 RepID=A0A401RLF5_CHIPU|nr:hypothetical protein [Chiloscyllium punctatum]
MESQMFFQVFAAHGDVEHSGHLMIRFIILHRPVNRFKENKIEVSDLKCSSNLHEAELCEQNTTSFVFNSEGNVYIDGNQVAIPLKAGGITIFWQSSMFIQVGTTFSLKLQVQIFPVMQLYISLSEHLKNSTKGLCGTFNDDATDDFLSQKGIVESTPITFADSWTVEDNCQVAEQPPSCLSSETDIYIKDYCDSIKDPKGSFSVCHSSVSYESYYAMCVAARCACENTNDCRCAGLGAYVHECAVHGVIVRNWMEGSCIKPCPKTQVFENDMRTCNRTCQSLSHYDYTCDVKDTPVYGCGCPEGKYMDNSGECIDKVDCSCYMGETVIEKGQSVTLNDQTCTCKAGYWECTNNPCPKDCLVHGEGHYVTFDGKRYLYDGNCEYVLVEAKEFKLHDGRMTRIEKSFGQTQCTDNSYSLHTVGLYLIIKFSNGITVIWDKRTRVSITLDPRWKNKVCGLCGNFNGDIADDLTTQGNCLVTSTLEFGNSWKSSVFCSNVMNQTFPCERNPYCSAWAQRKCSIIKTTVFQSCHSKVDPTPFYDTCVQETCSCDLEGRYLSFCTSIAVYAEACNKAGVCIDWRTPDLCPVYCDYYNAPEECSWHYHPCGTLTTKTCSDHYVGKKRGHYNSEANNNHLHYCLHIRCQYNHKTNYNQIHNQLHTG